jgi:UDP-3-O-[3-hydroxymyristoyl] glucosamine N-acyltransferase
MPQPVLIVGCDAYAQSIAQLINQHPNYSVVGYCEVGATALSASHTVLNNWPLTHISRVESDTPPNTCQIYVAFNPYKFNRSRRYYLDIMTAKGYLPITYVHPSAHVEPDAVMGAHGFIGPLCYLDNKAVVRDNTVLTHRVAVKRHAIVEADCWLDDNVYVGQGAHVEANTIINPHAIIKADQTVGAFSGIRAGAVVSKTIAKGTLQTPFSPYPILTHGAV